MKHRMLWDMAPQPAAEPGPVDLPKKAVATLAVLQLDLQGAVSCFWNPATLSMMPSCAGAPSRGSIV